MRLEAASSRRYCSLFAQDVNEHCTNRPRVAAGLPADADGPEIEGRREGQREGRSGSEIVKQAPPSGERPADAWPPSRVAKPATSANPTPVPTRRTPR